MATLHASGWLVGRLLGFHKRTCPRQFGSVQRMVGRYEVTIRFLIGRRLEKTQKLPRSLLGHDLALKITSQFCIQAQHPTVMVKRGNVRHAPSCLAGKEVKTIMDG